jgi:hypothetical protein
VILTYVEVGGFVLFGGLLGFAVSYLCRQWRGPSEEYVLGFEDGKDFALPLRDAKGRFQKVL